MLKGSKNKTDNDSPERLNRLVAGAELKGDLSTESNLRIDGAVDGNVHCDSKIVLGEKGTVKGDITATEIEVEGSVEGDLKVTDLLTLRKSAIIRGKIETSRLIIDDGAQIGGNIQTEDLPKNQGNPSKSTNNEPVSESQKSSDAVNE